MIPFREARQIVLEGCLRLTPRLFPIADARGCVTAAAIVTDEMVPPFTNSAMDGYAVRAADTVGAPVRLQVLGTALAGASPMFSVEPGAAVRTMTGAPLPRGADAVCMVEHTQMAGDSVLIGRAVAAGENVRYPGEDIRSGDVVFEAGTPLLPGHLGVLASIGVTEVPVFPRPRLGVLSTGDELVNDGEPLRPGTIRDANRRTLLALADQAGFDTVDLGIAGDNKEAIRDALRRGETLCDAIVTSGGVSVGDRDMVKVVLDELSAGTMRWMQVAVKPSKPLAFGTIASGTPVFGLPGNPVSAMVSFELFVRPALRAMAGHQAIDRPVVLGVADDDFPRRPDGKLHFLRVTAVAGPDGLLHASSAGGQASHQLRTMALANALALLPDGVGVGRGERLRLMVLDADRLGSGPIAGQGDEP